MGVRGADPDVELHGEPDVDAELLTVQQLRPTVTDVKELQRRGQYIGYQEGTFIEPMLKKMGFDERRMKKYRTVEQYAVALSKGSANGGVDAVFDEMPYLKTFLSQHCDGYMQVGPIYKTVGLSFVSSAPRRYTYDVGFVRNSDYTLLVCTYVRTKPLAAVWCRINEPAGLCATPS